MKVAVPLQTGDIVQLDGVVDGDTLSVKSSAGDDTQVRLLGIKAFEAVPERDPMSRFGRAAVDAHNQLIGDAPLRVLVHTTAQDKHGRTIATLYVGETDVGLALVQKGLAMVYTVYPFPGMPYYLEQQARARAEKKGIWADAAAVARADALGQEWRRRTE